MFRPPKGSWMCGRRARLRRRMDFRSERRKVTRSVRARHSLAKDREDVFERSLVPPGHRFERIPRRPQLWPRGLVQRTLRACVFDPPRKRAIGWFPRFESQRIETLRVAHDADDVGAHGSATYQSGELIALPRREPLFVTLIAEHSRVDRSAIQDLETCSELRGRSQTHSFPPDSRGRSSCSSLKTTTSGLSATHGKTMALGIFASGSIGVRKQGERARINVPRISGERHAESAAMVLARPVGLLRSYTSVRFAGTTCASSIINLAHSLIC